MKVTFIYHSCYTVETEGHFLIFDYIGGPLHIPKGKKIIWVVTHGHQDHFTRDIFDYPGEITYIISDDITEELPDRDIHMVSPHNTYEIGDIVVKTYGSTDEGISVWIGVDGRGIYHSGDLNYWIWPRYDEEDIRQMEIDFTSEVDKAAKEPMDVAMIIVDPRLKEDYSLAGSYYLKTLPAKYFFPLHMWEKYELSRRFKEEFQPLYPDKEIMVIEREGQSFSLDI